MALPAPPPDIDLTEDRRGAFVAVSVLSWVLCLVAVGLRLMSRRMRDASLWIDDWLILAALPPSAIYVFAMAGYAVSRGVGQHIWVTPPDSMVAWALALVLSEITYAMTMTFVKLSILAFYWRTFHVHRSIRISIWILGTVCILWGFATIVVALAQCQPTHAFWSRFDRDHPLSPSEYKCGVDELKFFYANAVPTILTDLLVMALPIPYILALRLRGPQKLALTGIFLVGIFVTLVSVIRLHYLVIGSLDGVDVTWTFFNIGVWSIVEGNVAIICACLPFLRPVFNKMTFGFFHISSIGSHNHSRNPFKRGNRSTSQRWDEVGQRGESSTVVKARGDNESEENPFASSAIALPVLSGSEAAGRNSMNSGGSDEPRDGSLGDRIVVTTEFMMQHGPSEMNPRAK